MTSWIPENNLLTLKIPLKLTQTERSTKIVTIIFIIDHMRSPCHATLLLCYFVNMVALYCSNNDLFPPRAIDQFFIKSFNCVSAASSVLAIVDHLCIMFQSLSFYLWCVCMFIQTSFNLESYVKGHIS